MYYPLTKLQITSKFLLQIGARAWSSEIFIERRIHPKLLTLTSGGTLAIFTLFARPLKLLYSPSKWQGISIIHSHALCRISFHKKTGFVVHKLSGCYISYKHICTLQQEIIPVKHSVTKLWKKQNQDVESNKTWKQKSLEVHLNTSKIFKALQFSKISLSSHKLEDYGSKGTSSDWAH
jgi:hypothetical protein